MSRSGDQYLRISTNVEPTSRHYKVDCAGDLYSDKNTSKSTIRKIVGGLPKKENSLSWHETSERACSIRPFRLRFSPSIIVSMPGGINTLGR